MATALRAIVTDRYKLVQYQLPTGEQYFIQSSDEAPETLNTVPGGEVSLHPYSLVSAYSDVDTPLVFLNRGGLTVVKSSSAVFLLKTEITGEVPSHPLPLVTEADSEQIQRYSDRIRLVASQRRLSALSDFPGIVQAFNRAVEDSTRRADEAVRLADESLQFLLQNLASIEADNPLYSEIRQTTVDQMKMKLHDYNKLMTLIDQLVEQKRGIEELTLLVQKQIKPITGIAESLPYIS